MENERIEKAGQAMRAAESVASVNREQNQTEGLKELRAQTVCEVIDRSIQQHLDEIVRLTELKKQTPLALLGASHQTLLRLVNANYPFS